MAPLLHPDEWQAQLGDRVPDEIVGSLVAHRDDHGLAVDDRLEPGRAEAIRQRRSSGFGRRHR
jgi:hypothetical protein